MKPPTQDQLDEIERKRYVDADIVRMVMARVPPSWRLIEFATSSSETSAWRRGTLQVLMSVNREQDGELWIHVSVCGRRGEREYYLPSWDELKRVKHDFIGADKWAYQVFPEEAEWINVHPSVLHLFTKLDGKPALPDFTWGVGML